MSYHSVHEHSHTDNDIVAFPGYYTHISTLADVQENVMEYLHVLSRPMVINHDHDIIWTEAYMDTVVSSAGHLTYSLERPSSRTYCTTVHHFHFHLVFPLNVFDFMLICLLP